MQLILPPLLYDKKNTFGSDKGGPKPAHFEQCKIELLLCSVLFWPHNGFFRASVSVCAQLSAKDITRTEFSQLERPRY
mgnify:CR=1 FL=1